MLALAASTSAALSNAELYQRVALEKERSFAILANIADGIVAVDREGQVVLWNEAAAKITGVAAEHALGRAPVEVIQGTLESGSDAPVGDRLVSIMRGREEVWLSVTEAVMLDPAGAVAGRIFAFRDISSDRLVEQMKSDFVSTVSHELRTPLTSIYGFAETLLRQDVLFGETERTTFLGYIASESQRLTAIVDALLNVARLDTGDLQVNLSSTDVNDVVGEVVQNAQDAVRDGTSIHHRRFPSGRLLRTLTVEAARSSRSCSTTPSPVLSRGGTVTVGVERASTTPSKSASSDEGIGIAGGPGADPSAVHRDADAERAWAPAGRARPLHRARIRGTAMGGRIRVESGRRGIGVRRRVALPGGASEGRPGNRRGHR